MSLEEKIIRQIEYYFGDINLSKDKFMKEEIQKDAGWVSLETLTKFNRLKELSTDHKVIVEALKKSQAQLLEIDEVGAKVRRAKALPDNLGEFETNLKQNTVYVKGFPTTMVLDDFYPFFEKHGKVLQVFMRRFPTTKQFKGSVFVTFETSEQSKTFLEQLSPKYNDADLILESQEDYIKRKGPELASIKESKLKKEQQKEQKLKQKQEAEEAYLKEQQVLGAVLHLKGFNGEATREAIKEVFDSHGQIKWVDFSKGQVEGYVRFAEAGQAALALAKAKEAKAENGELMVKGAKIEARVIDGEEEMEYWKVLIRDLCERRNKNKSGGGGGGGGNKRRNNKNNRNGGGGHKNNYGKKRAHDDDEDNDDDDDGNGNDNSGEDGENKNESNESKVVKKVKTTDQAEQKQVQEQEQVVQV